MKKIIELIKENKTSYLIAMTLAPVVYIILKLILNGKIEWYGAVIASILAGIIYTVLKVFTRSDK